MTRAEIAAAFICAASLVVLPFIGMAHEAATGWRYDGWCCNAATGAHSGDCYAVPDHAVEAREDGWHVTLRPDDHPLVTVEHSWVVPYAGQQVRINGRPTLVVNAEGQAMPTRVHLPEDDHWHVCLYPNEATLRCLYLKMGDS